MEVIAYLTALAMIGIMSPGPDFVAVSQATLLKDKVTSINFFIAGIAIGNGFWVFTALLGIDRLFHVYPDLLSALKLVGGTYLCYLGVKSLGYWASKSGSGQTLGYGGVYKGLMITMSNPKAALFYLAIFSSSLPDEINKTIFFLIVSISFATFVWFFAISSLLQYRGVFTFYKSKEAYINKLFGVLFIYFGGFQLFQLITEQIS